MVLDVTFSEILIYVACVMCMIFPIVCCYMLYRIIINLEELDWKVSVLVKENNNNNNYEYLEDETNY